MGDLDDFRIVMTGPGRGEIYRNGEMLNGVKGFVLSASVEEPTTLTVEFVVIGVEYCGPALLVEKQNEQGVTDG